MKPFKICKWALFASLLTLSRPALAQSDGVSDETLSSPAGEAPAEINREELKAALKAELLAELKSEIKAEVREEVKSEVKEELKAELKAEAEAKAAEEAKEAKDGNSDVLAAATPQKAEKESLFKKIMEGFTFGSYGRVPVGGDLHGSLGKQVQLVAHAPRLLESPYAEIDLGYAYTVTDGPTFRPHFTLALNEALFHLDGNFAAAIAVRNLYLEISDLFIKGLSFWGGSRMYRGDDIYLLDFWPLDEQNTIGGGVAYRFADSEVKLHMGVNRLASDYQLQNVDVISDTVGARTITFMERARFVLTLRGAHNFNISARLGLKGVLYAEYHYLPSGQYLTEKMNLKSLPEDHGLVIGGELSLYKPNTANHLNIFVKYGYGLGAYDEMAVPTGLNPEKQALGSHELVLGLSGNIEFGEKAGLMLAYYFRKFTDADPNQYDVDDLNEMAFAVRPAFYIHKYFHLLAELNFQYKRPNGLNPENGLHDQPFAFTAALMPTLSMGYGSYARPQLRLVYALTVLNDAAMRTYAALDARRDRRVQHWLGINCEWWFNSSRH